MPQRILILTPSPETAAHMDAVLQGCGFPVTYHDGLTKPSEQEHLPALCIVDLALHRSPSGGPWDSWLQDCISEHIACLAFDLQGAPDRKAIARLEPLADILRSPGDAGLLEDRVRSLLTIRKLHRQLDAAHHQLARHQKELQESLRSAATIQRSLIPSRRDTLLDLTLAWRFMPSKQVGGDLFNIVQLDEQTVMVYLVDVSGHGVSSAMVTVSVHQSLSLHTSQIIKRPLDHPPHYEIVSPSDVMKELEAEYPYERFQEFFTICYLLINPHTGDLRYCNAGHPPPLLLRRNGCVERLDRGGPLIGMGSPLPFEEGGIRLQRGDRLYLYTDGITEHTNTNGALYGEQRFLAQLLEQVDQPLEDTVQSALVTMREFGGSSLPTDDVTLIGLEYAPAPHPVP